jgi:hypothetical protein
MTDLLGPGSLFNGSLGTLARPTRPEEPAGDYGTDDTWFGDCTDPSRRDGTWIAARFLNKLVAQIRVVIRAAAIPEDNADDQMLYKAIRAIALANASAPELSPAVLPAGLIWPFTGLVAPANTLLADGGLRLRADYPALWAHALTSAMLVTDAQWLNPANAYQGMYSAGDGATTFRVPNLGGAFLRGLAAGRTLGSWQDYATARPKTTSPEMVLNSGETSPTFTGRGIESPAPSHPSQVGFARLSKAGEKRTAAGMDTIDSGFEMDVEAVVSGDTETRPANIAYPYVISTGPLPGGA